MIEIKASDNVRNNDPTPSSFSWTIDTAPPQPHHLCNRRPENCNCRW
jgi:hypothetical protein